jgi:hypothetical protein
MAAMVLALSALALGCGDDEESADGTFDVDGFPFTFSYPADFEETEDPTVAQQLGGEANESAAVGLDDDNGILVQTFTLKASVDRSNLQDVKAEITALIEQADPDTSSRTDEVAGLPAVVVEDVDVPSIDQGESRLVFLFDGDQEYQLNCQWTPDGREAVGTACDQAVETLKLR